jgi:hypothetical protein
MARLARTPEIEPMFTMRPRSAMTSGWNALIIITGPYTFTFMQTSNSSRLISSIVPSVATPALLQRAGDSLHRLAIARQTAGHLM